MKLPISSFTKFIELAKDLCRQNNSKLLFLTLFGSNLYGTESLGKSDIDLRGIFLPSLESLALNMAPKSLHFSTGNKERRNTNNDVDIDLWSLQHWLLKLLPAGDTGALDLIFSPSNINATIYRHSMLDQIFAQPLRLMDTCSGKAYAEYSLGQAKKYGIKGSRLGALKRAWRWTQGGNIAVHQNDKLLPFINEIIIHCDDQRFCYSTETAQGPALHLCGKTYMGAIRLTEFVQRIKNDMERYGCRAMEAERSEGIDFKAISHAVRALYQIEELLLTGKIIFPLQKRKKVLAVKEGAIPWKELETYISTRLTAIDDLKETAPYCGHYEPDFANECILNCYTYHHMPEATANFTPGFNIPAQTLSAIKQRLDAVEKKYDVSILYACESGSRGWGFASKDSDFDVRFIYIHKPSWYLGIAPEEKPDVIELGIEQNPVGELDINGWEIRKALKLFKRSNQPLYEWLSSPLIYLERGTLAQTLRDVSPAVLSPLRGWHHYHSLMKKAWNSYKEKKGSIKKWFYVLRPLMAMQWLEQGLGVVPMRFQVLMNGIIDDDDLRKELNALVVLKCSGQEKDDFKPSARILTYVESIMHKYSEPPKLPTQTNNSSLDYIFDNTIHEIWGTSDSKTLNIPPNK